MTAAKRRMSLRSFSERIVSRIVVLVGADRGRLLGERALDVRQVLLHDADHRELEVGEHGHRHLGLALRAFVLEHLGLGVRRGLAGHVELHADLVQLQRRELARERSRPTRGAARRCGRRATRRAAPRSCTRGCTRGCACSCGSRRGARSRSRPPRRCARGRSSPRRARTCIRAHACRRSPRAGGARRLPSPSRCVRAPAGSVRPRRSPSTAYGRASSGKSHCTALSSSLSTSSSSRRSAVVVKGSSPGSGCGPSMVARRLRRRGVGSSRVASRAGYFVTRLPSVAVTCSVCVAPLQAERDRLSRARSAARGP